MKLDIPNPAGDDEPDLTPMIDVVFLLIIFFMIVANVITSEKVKIRMPIAELSKIPEEPGQRQTITIMSDGSMYAGLSKVTPDIITAKCKQGRAANGKDFKVFIRADADTQHQDVRTVMEACSAGNVFNVIFATYQTEI